MAMEMITRKLPTPSPAQQAIIDAWTNYTRPLFIGAVAGSGKTTTLLMLINSIEDRYYRSTIYLAFGSKMAKEIKPKLPMGVNCSTIHAQGLRCVKKWAEVNQIELPPADDWIDYDKYRSVTNYWLSLNGLDPNQQHPTYTSEELDDFQTALRDLVHFAMATLTDPTNEDRLLAIADHYDVICIEPLLPALLQGVNDCVQWGFEGVEIPDVGLMFSLKQSIGGDDMLYWPHVMDMPAAWTFNNLLVDEAQDLGPSQRSMVKRVAGRNAKYVFVGDRCQPAGTMVSRVKDPQRIIGGHPSGYVSANIEEVPIECLEVGDRVVGYESRSGAFSQNGRAVTGITKRSYQGTMITVTTDDGKISRYTPNHICYANFSSLRTKWCVYLMEKDGHYRIGRSRFDISGNAGCGVIRRAIAERADKLWILNTYDSAFQASIHERAIAGKFGLSELTFQCPNTHASIFDQDVLNHCWEFIGRQPERAQECLQAFGRLIEYPLWDRSINLTHQFSLKRPEEIRACNLINGCKLLTYAGKAHYNNTLWRPISITKDNFDGFVWSLSVEKELYVADGILTHNCQAIMGFAGADCDSVDRIVDEFGAMELPLNVCYRCPVGPINLASRIVNDLQPAPNAIIGEMYHAPEEFACDRMRPGDMVMCRLTSPLVSIYYYLLRAKIPAKIIGRDLSGQIIKNIEKIGRMKGFDWEHFPEFLNEFRENQTKSLKLRKNGERLIERLMDQCATISALYNAMVDPATPEEERAESIPQMVKHVEKLFTDNPNECVSLATAHRCKGLEAENTFIVSPALMPFERSAFGWHLQQEYNLLYVALTRVQKRMVFVGEGASTMGHGSHVIFRFPLPEGRLEIPVLDWKKALKAASEQTTLELDARLDPWPNGYQDCPACRVKGAAHCDGRRILCDVCGFEESAIPSRAILNPPPAAPVPQACLPLPIEPAPAIEVDDDDIFSGSWPENTPEPPTTPQFDTTALLVILNRAHAQAGWNPVSTRAAIQEAIDMLTKGSS